MARWDLRWEERTHRIPVKDAPPRVCFTGHVLTDTQLDPFEAFWTCPNCQHDMHDIGGTTYDETQLTEGL